MSVSCLVISDFHLDPDEAAVSIDNVSVPAGIDFVISAGDLIDDPDPSDIEYGRKFLRRLTADETPILCIPGNHDHLEYTMAMVDGIDYAGCLHRETITIGDVCPGSGVDDTLIVGWGCEQFHQDPGIDFERFPSLLDRIEETLDPSQTREPIWSSEIETLGAYCWGEIGPEELTERLNVDGAVLATALQSVQSDARELAELLVRPSSPPILVTHVPPFGSTLDHHHSDIVGRFVGSMAFRIALSRVHTGLLISGHTHVADSTYDSVAKHVIGPGKRREVRIDFEADGLSYSWLHREE